jgi:phage-related protein
MSGAVGIKPVFWIGGSKGDLSRFPEDVRDTVGYALFVAQQGGKHAAAKPLQGSGGAGVLHAFQKKAKSGVRTPKADIDLIKARLERAEQQHAEWTRLKG